MTSRKQGVNDGDDENHPSASQTQNTAQGPAPPAQHYNRSHNSHRDMDKDYTDKVLAPHKDEVDKPEQVHKPRSQLSQ